MSAPVDETLVASNNATSLMATRDAPPTPGSHGEAEELERGSVVGRYVVLAKLGAGGMGVVHAAYDPELDRKVALKLLLSGTGGGGSEGRTRLLREAQALAKLSHPNVVAIHDVGALGERVWLAMEYVDGHTLGAWLGQRRRGWREVLDTMVAAGRGLSAAHAAGLLHRDFKPDNVMVGNDGRVRVMDFGLARTADAEPVANGQPSADQELLMASSERTALTTEVTRAGAMMGTPAYMSPEQFHGSADARSDQFSYCATLWEAVHGQRPFGGESLVELATNVLDGKLREPPRGAKVPKWLRRVLERGLAVEPDKRWPSIDALLDALARGHTRARARVAVVAVAAVGLLIAGAVATQRYLEAERLAERVAACEAQGDSIDEVWGDDARARVRAAILNTNESYAPTTADKLALWLDDQANAWREAQTEVCMNATVRGSWDADTLDRATWCLDDRRLELAALVTELERADAQVVQRAVAAAAGLTKVSPCLDAAVLERLPAPPLEQSRQSIREVRAELAHATTLEAAGKFAEGLEVIGAAKSRAEGLGWPPLLAAVRQREGGLLLRSGSHAEAEAASAAAYLEAAKSGAWATAADAATNLVFVVGHQQARHAEGQTWAGHTELAISYAGDPLGLREANRLSNLGNIHGDMGAYDQARALHERSLAIREQALGPDHPEVGRSLNNLGIVHQLGGAYDQAKPLFERSLAIQEQALGPDHPDVANSLSNLGSVYSRIGEYEQAKVLHERSLAIREQALGPDHPLVASNLSHLGNVLESTGKHEEARALYERALAIREKALGPDHPSVAASVHNLAALYDSTGAYDEARPLYERALAIVENKLGPDHRDIAYPLVGLTDVALKQQKPADAVPLANRLVGVLEASGAPATELARARFMLARALWDAPAQLGRDRTRSLEQAKLAREAYREAKAEKLAEVEAWLAERESTL